METKVLYACGGFITGLLVASFIYTSLEVEFMSSKQSPALSSRIPDVHERVIHLCADSLIFDPYS